jgi:hypothetical protein
VKKESLEKESRKRKVKKLLKIEDDDESIQLDEMD